MAHIDKVEEGLKTTSTSCTEENTLNHDEVSRSLSVMFRELKRGFSRKKEFMDMKSADRVG